MAELKACPQCGSPAVDYSSIIGSSANCRICGWSGTSTELYAVASKHAAQDFLEEEQTFHAMYSDLRVIFRDTAAVTTRFLSKWGFVRIQRRGTDIEIVDPKEVMRYLNAIFQAAFKAVLTVREELEQEANSGRRAS